jgi:hypothetical protein
MGDVFDDWFAVFSTEHSWYKTGPEHNFVMIPQNDVDRPWTLHPWYIPSNLPRAVRRILSAHPTPINGLIYGRHSYGHGLHIAIGNGGWPFVDWIEKRYPKAGKKLREACNDNSAADDRRYKIRLVRYVDPEKGVVWNMFCREYRRMCRKARKQYYRMLSQLYPWIRQHMAKSQTSLGDLTYVANQYMGQITQFKQTLLHFVPPELVDICQEYHHVF